MVLLLQEASQDQRLLRGLVADQGSLLVIALHRHLGLLVLQLQPHNRQAMHLGNIRALQELAAVHHHLPQLLHGSKVARLHLTPGTRILLDQMPLRPHLLPAILASPTHTIPMEDITHRMAHLHLHLLLHLLAGYVETSFFLLCYSIYLLTVIYHHAYANSLSLW